MRLTRRHKANVLEEEDLLLPSIGSLSGTFAGEGPIPKREFPIGFHVAAPGPSHPDPSLEPAPRRPRARKRST